ncbi:MAG: DMT family transporter [Treponema sp.]|jgi:drug/metabolite transporter (DMT)-like permease|nr:DMT family transporter [Treponema sp.]
MKPIQIRRSNPTLALLLCALGWSTGGFLIKSIDWNPFAIAGIRSLIAAATILLVIRRVPSFVVRTPAGTVDRGQTAACFIATVAYSLTMILFVLSNKMTTAANAILLQYTNPLYVILLSPLVLGEKNKAIDYVTVAGVFAGMILFLLEGIHGGAPLGNILAALSGVTFGVTTVFMRKQKDGHPSDSFLFAHLITVIAMCPFYFISPLPSLASWGGLLALGFFQVGLPSVLYSIGIVRIAAVSAVLLTMLEPLMNPVWVFLFHREAPSATSIAGGVIILGFLVLRTVVKSGKVKTPKH